MGSDLTCVAQRLIEWGNLNADDYPWRWPDTAYESVVAEIFLIRTPPHQVLPVYRRFMHCYPIIQDLYHADPQDVETIIEPLGLKWKAPMLLCMAEYVMVAFAGIFPRSMRALVSIPGLGPYTAAAVKCFFYRQRAVFVDTNTVRFFFRYCSHTYGAEPRRDHHLFADMDSLTPNSDDEAVRFNTAFLDFMRKICRRKPGLPKCDMCPLSRSCSFLVPEFYGWE